MKKRVISIIRNIFDGVMIFVLFITTTVYALPSNGVIYDNSNSGSSATNVSEAIDDLYSKLTTKEAEINRLKGLGNVASNQMLKGYTALVKGNLVTGTIPSKGAATYTPGITNQTIASGNYLSGTQTIMGDANLVAGNIAKGKSIFGVAGSYTSDANAVAGNILSGKTAYVNGAKITGSIPSKGATTYTPGKTNQTIASGNYLSGTQTIKGDANLVAGNIAKGKSIFGVTGSYTSDANATAGNILSGKTAYVNGVKITGTIPSKGATTYTPGKTNQTIASGNYLSGVQTIKGDANLVAGNIKKGVSIFGVSGSYTPTGTNAGIHLTTASGNTCGADWTLTSTLSAGTYIVATVMTNSAGIGASSRMDFGPVACGYGACSGVSVIKLAENISNNVVVGTRVVTLSKSFASGSPMGRMDTCSDNKYGTLYGRALWVKIS